MAEPTVSLRKAAGGCTITAPDGAKFTWKKDGDVVKVPYEFAMTLVGIPGAGYSVEGDPASEAAAVPDPPADLSRTDASPITPKATAATVKPPAPEPPAEPAPVAKADPEPPAEPEQPDAPASGKKS